MSKSQERRILRAGEGELMGPPGVQDRFVLGAAMTGGRVAVVEHVLAPGRLAAPMHHHTREDEFSFVVRGTVGASLGGDEVVAHAGDFVFKPRGEWHTFWNAGDDEARILELITPAGLDDLFRWMDSLDTEPDPEVLASRASEYGCSLDFDATMSILERHQLEF